MQDMAYINVINGLQQSLPKQPMLRRRIQLQGCIDALADCAVAAFMLRRSTSCADARLCDRPVREAA
jgi:hypothetical protein